MNDRLHIEWLPDLRVAMRVKGFERSARVQLSVWNELQKLKGCECVTPDCWDAFVAEYVERPHDLNIVRRRWRQTSSMPSGSFCYCGGDFATGMGTRSCKHFGAIGEDLSKSGQRTRIARDPGAIRSLIEYT